MENTKTNDWLATLVKNPDMNLTDLRRKGITADNTAMKSRDDYKNMKAVREAEIFQNPETKQFDEKKFNAYYDNALALYNNYATDDQLGRIADFAYASDEFWAPTEAKRLDLAPTVSLANPLSEYNQGLDWLGSIHDTAGTRSVREIAQTQEVVDNLTGESLGYTPNDFAGSIKGLFKSIARPTLVLAQWDSDGEHINENGETVHHMAGEFKIRNGKPYYETLGDRDIFGKDVLRVSDTLTVDGGRFNKIDIFDSDDIKKSIGKTAAKTAVSVAAMMIPYVGEAYGYVTAAKELARVLPVLSKGIDSAIFGTDDNAFGKGMKAWEGYMARFDQTQSDYSREHQVSLENLGNLVTSIGGQLFQQRAIANVGMLMTKNASLARELSFGYMAMTSAQDSYDAFKQAGASDRVAGLGMLASMGALGALMQQDYFRKYSPLKGTIMDEAPVIGAAQGLGKKVADEMVERKLLQEAELQPMKFLQRCKSVYTKNLVQGISKHEIVNRALSEGIEETMEEVSTDLVKGLTAGLNLLGVNVTENNQDLNFGFSLSDIASRYTMNFLGGLAGGAIFYGQNKWETFIKNGGHMPKYEGDDMTRLTYLIAAGYGDSIKAYYKKWHKRGWLGNPNLSMKSELINSIDGQQMISTTDGTSQNDVVYKLLCDYVDNIESQIKTTAPFLTSKADWENIVKYGYDTAEIANNPKLLNASAIVALSTHSDMYQDTMQNMAEIVTLTNEIAEEEAKIRASITGDTNADKEARDKAVKDSEIIKKKQEEIKKRQQFIKDVRDGKKNRYYLGQALFMANEDLNSCYGNLSEDQYAQQKYGNTLDTFTPEQQESIKEDYAEFMQLKGRDHIRKSYDTYLALSERLAPRIKEELAALEKATKEELSLNDFIGQDVYQPEEYQKLIAERKALLEQGKAIDDKKVKDLDIKIAEMNAKMAKIENNPMFALLRNATGREFYDLFKVDETGKIRSVDTSALADAVMNFYKNRAGENGAYVLDESMYHTLIDQVVGEYQAAYDSFDNLSDTILGEGIHDEDAFMNIGEDLRTSYDGMIAALKAYDNKAFVDNYNAYKNVLEENMENEEDRAKFLNALPQINNKPIIDYINELDGYRKNCKTSVLAQLVGQLNFELNGNRINLLDLIEQEKKKLSNNAKLSDYIINDPGIKQLFVDNGAYAQIMNSIFGVLTGMYDGTNENINNYKKNDDETADLPALTTLNDAQFANIASQYADITQKLEFLRTLSANNSGNAFRLQRDIAINMRPKFVDVLVKSGDSFKATFGVDIKDLWEQAKKGAVIPLNNVQVNDYPETEKAILRFEDLLYEEFNKLGLSTKNLADKIVTFRKCGKLAELTSTQLSKLEDQTIEPYDLCMYIASLTSLRSSDFYGRLNGIMDELVTKDGKELAPVYGQEYAVRLASSMIANSDLFNNILERLNEDDVIKEYTPTQSDIQKVQKILKERPTLYNLVVTLGSAGTGKTVGVAGTLFKMINNPDVEFIAIGPETEQAEKIASQLDNSVKALSKKDLFEKILGRELKAKDMLVTESEHIAIAPSAKKKVNGSNAIFTGSKKAQFLVIDEIGKFSDGELGFLCNWAKKNNVFIIGLGDLKQSASEIKVTDANGKTTTRYNCLEDCTFVKSPVLTASLRLQNLAKLDNYLYMDTIMNKLREQIHPDTTPSDIASKVTEPLALYYYEDKDHTTICGEKIIDAKTDIIEAATPIVEANPNKEIAIIVDKETPELKKFAKEHSNVKIQLYKSMQGGEWDYVFVDVDFKKETNKYSLLRSFYTLSQRSRIGTIIKNNDIFGTNKLTLSDNVNKIAGKAELGTDNNTAAKDFKEWRKLSLSEISETDGYLNKIMRGMDNGEISPEEVEAKKKAEEERLAKEQAEQERLRQEAEAKAKAEEEAKRKAQEEERRRKEAEAAAAQAAAQAAIDEEEKRKKQEEADRLAAAAKAMQTPDEDPLTDPEELKPTEIAPPESVAARPTVNPAPIPDTTAPEATSPDSVVEEKPKKKRERKARVVHNKLQFNNEEFFNMFLDGQSFNNLSGIQLLQKPEVLGSNSMNLLLHVASYVRCTGKALTTDDWKQIYQDCNLDRTERRKLATVLAPFIDGTHELWVTSYNDDGDGVLVYRLTNVNGETLDFPVAFLPDCHKYGKYTGEISFVKGPQIDQEAAATSWSTLSNITSRGINRIFTFSNTTGIIVGEDGDIDNSELSRGAKTFLKKCKGMAFSIMSDEVYWMRDQAKIWNPEDKNAITNYRRVSLVATQVSVDPKTIFNRIAEWAQALNLTGEEETFALLEYLEQYHDTNYDTQYQDLLTSVTKEDSFKKRYQILSPKNAAAFITAIMDGSSKGSEQARFNFRAYANGNTGKRKFAFRLSADGNEYLLYGKDNKFELHPIVNGNVEEAIHTSSLDARNWRKLVNQIAPNGFDEFLLTSIDKNNQLHDFTINDTLYALTKGMYNSNKLGKRIDLLCEELAASEKYKYGIFVQDTTSETRLGASDGWFRSIETPANARWTQATKFIPSSYSIDYNAIEGEEMQPIPPTTGTTVESPITEETPVEVSETTAETTIAPVTEVEPVETTPVEEEEQTFLPTNVRDQFKQLPGYNVAMNEVIERCIELDSLDPINGYYEESSKNWRHPQVILEDGQLKTIYNGDENFKNWFCKRFNIPVEAQFNLMGATLTNNDIATEINHCNYAYFFVSLQDKPSTTLAVRINENGELVVREVANEDVVASLSDVMDILHELERNMQDPSNTGTSISEIYNDCVNYITALLNGSDSDYASEYMNDMAVVDTILAEIAQKRANGEIVFGDEYNVTETQLQLLTKFNDSIVDFLQKKLELDDECL